MKTLLIAGALFAFGMTLDTGAAFAQKIAAAAKCDYAQCVQRCTLNRGRYCAAACKRCQ